MQAAKDQSEKDTTRLSTGLSAMLGFRLVIRWGLLMTTDDLNRPLERLRCRHPSNSNNQIFAALLATALLALVLWATIGENFYGGKAIPPLAIDGHRAIGTKRPQATNTPASAHDPVQDRIADDAGAKQPAQAPRATTRTPKTVTIIDGKTGAREEVIIPATGE